MREVPPRMRAAVITAPRTCKVELVATPAPKPGQVLIRVEGCGVCGSNLPRWEGRPWFEYPAEPGNPGHEGWGRVVAAGKEVAPGMLGRRVAFLSDHAFAEYDVAPASAAVPLPQILDGRDVPGEPLGCAMNIWRRCDIQRGHTVAIIGLGFVGALLTQLAARADARVIAISQRAYSRDLAFAMGAAEAIALGDDDAPIVSRVQALTGGALCERVIEVVGLQRPLDLAAKLTGVRGRLVIAGLHQDGLRSVDMFQWNSRGIDVINAHERETSTCVAGMTAAIDRLATGGLEPERLYTHRVPLERATEAFEALRTRPMGFVKAMVTP
jgi:threonine dehydrogenase-like Zn-dependent dehydrogenase